MYNQNIYKPYTITQELRLPILECMVHKNTSFLTNPINGRKIKEIYICLKLTFRNPLRDLLSVNLCQAFKVSNEVANTFIILKVFTQTKILP